MNYTEDQLHTLELLPYVALARKAGRSTMPVAISSATSAARSAADAVAGIRGSRVGETAIPLSRVAINTIPGLVATPARVGRGGLREIPEPSVPCDPPK